MSSALPDRVSAATRPAIAVLLFLGVTAFQVAISRGVFVYGDDILMYEVARSIVEGRGLEVTSPSDRGEVARSIPGTGGRRYAKYGIGLSLVAAPVTALGDRDPIRSMDLPETVDDEGNPRAGARIFAAGLTNTVVAGALAAALFLLAVGARLRPAIRSRDRAPREPRLTDPALRRRFPVGAALGALPRRRRAGVGEKRKAP